MDDWISAFLSDLRTNKAYAENTLAAYHVDIVQFSNFLSLQRPRLLSWSRIDKPLLLEYILHLRARSYSPSSIARKIAAIKTFFYFLLERGAISVNPTDQLDSPHIKRADPHPLAPGDIERLLRAPASDGSPKAWRDRALLEVLAATGLRVSEITGLDLRDVDETAQALVCRKEGGARRLPLRTPAWQALSDYMQQGRPKLGASEKTEGLFLNQQGDRLSRQGLWLILKEYVQAAGIDPAVTANTLRHSFAMQLLREGQTLEHVQQWLGHSSKTTTQKYTLHVPGGSNGALDESRNQGETNHAIHDNRDRIRQEPAQ